jgi:predicted small secreted protein
MEIDRRHTPKNLHHHALPIIITAVAVLVVSIPLVFQQNTATGNGVAIVHELFTRPLNVKHTSNGFAHLTLNDNANEHISPEVEQAGWTTELVFTLNRSEP